MKTIIQKLFFACLLLTATTAAHAQVTITPTAGIVYVDAAASGGNGSSWANADKELADALLAAASNSAIQQIWVAAGAYKPLYDADGYNRNATPAPKP